MVKIPRRKEIDPKEIKDFLESEKDVTSAKKLYPSPQIHHPENNSRELKSG